jgi:hypothetical protein
MRIKQLVAVFAALMMALLPSMASASVASNTVVVPVVLNIPESISLTTSASTVTLTNAQPSVTLTLTASYQIASGHTTATVYSWWGTLPGVGGTTIPSADFSTSFNGGSPVVCNQGFFNVSTIGLSGNNCGSFPLSQNVATDLNDSASISFTLNALPAAFALAPNTYTGGVLNLLFQIV